MDQIRSIIAAALPRLARLRAEASTGPWFEEPTTGAVMGGVKLEERPDYEPPIREKRPNESDEAYQAYLHRDYDEGEEGTFDPGDDVYPSATLNVMFEDGARCMQGDSQLVIAAVNLVFDILDATPALPDSPTSLIPSSGSPR